MPGCLWDHRGLSSDGLDKWKMGKYHRNYFSDKCRMQLKQYSRVLGYFVRDVGKVPSSLRSPLSSFVKWEFNPEMSPIGL